MKHRTLTILSLVATVIWGVVLATGVSAVLVILWEWALR